MYSGDEIPMAQIWSLRTLLLTLFIAGTLPAQVSVTIASNPSGAGFTVSGTGCAGGSYTTPQTLGPVKAPARDWHCGVLTSRLDVAEIYRNSAPSLTPNTRCCRAETRISRLFNTTTGASERLGIRQDRDPRLRLRRLKRRTPRASRRFLTGLIRGGVPQAARLQSHVEPAHTWQVSR